MQNYFVNIPFNKSSAKHYIYHNFDHEIDEKLYENFDENQMPIIYNYLYKYLKKQTNKRPIVFSPDYSISSSTCCAIAEKYMTNYDEDGIVKYTSDMKILYITSSTHVSNIKNLTAIEFTKSIITNMIDLDENNVSYTKHQLLISPEQIIMVGINDNIVEQQDLQKLNDIGVKNFTLKQMRKKGIKDICEYIVSELDENPTYVIYDMSSLSFENAPSVFRLIDDHKDKNKLDGFTIQEIKTLFNIFKKLNIVGLDITGFNLKENTPDVSLKITINSAQLALTELLQLKQKKINLFNKYTKIVICKPISENIIYLNNTANLDCDDVDNVTMKDNEDEEMNIGWFIMRGLSTDLKEQLITKIDENDDKIISFNIDGEKMYISYTTIEEQEGKSYYASNSIKDRVLTAGEKVNLMFSQL